MEQNGCCSCGIEADTISWYYSMSHVSVIRQCCFKSRLHFHCLHCFSIAWLVGWLVACLSLFRVRFVHHTRAQSWRNCISKSAYTATQTEWCSQIYICKMVVMTRFRFSLRRTSWSGTMCSIQTREWSIDSPL